MQTLGSHNNQDDTEMPRELSREEGAREITIEVILSATNLSVGKTEHLSHYLKRITHLVLNGNATKTLVKSGGDREAFRKIQNLHHCPNLKVLYLYDNKIEIIENLAEVPQLTQLHLQGNCLQKIENLEPLQLLEKLFLEKNSISRLEGLAECTRLQELYLANQDVSISRTFSFEAETMQALASSLRVLDLSNCRVASTKSLTSLRSLEQLDLSKNVVSDVKELLLLISEVTSLVELDLRENPVTGTAKYREKMITFSSARLVLLDKKAIDSNQRRMMQSHLSHTYRKRLEPNSYPSRLSLSESKRNNESNGPSESTRLLKHGATVHQLRSIKQFSAKQKSVKCGLKGFGIDGASCCPSSSALIKASSNLGEHRNTSNVSKKM